MSKRHILGWHILVSFMWYTTSTIISNSTGAELDSSASSGSFYHGSWFYICIHCSSHLRCVIFLRSPWNHYFLLSHVECHHLCGSFSLTLFGICPHVRTNVVVSDRAPTQPGSSTKRNLLVHLSEQLDLALVRHFGSVFSVLFSMSGKFSPCSIKYGRWVLHASGMTKEIPIPFLLLKLSSTGLLFTFNVKS